MNPITNDFVVVILDYNTHDEGIFLSLTCPRDPKRKQLVFNTILKKQILCTAVIINLQRKGNISIVISILVIAQLIICSVVEGLESTTSNPVTTSGVGSIPGRCFGSLARRKVV
jgi:hypothetical protein